MSETITGSRLLTTKEVATILRKTPDAVRMLRHRGLGPRGFREGRQTLYPEANVWAYLAAKEAGDRVGQRVA